MEIELELNDDSVDDIVVAHLRQQYEYLTEDIDELKATKETLPAFRLEDLSDFKKARKHILKTIAYYSVKEEHEKWLASLT